MAGNAFCPKCGTRLAEGKCPVCGYWDEEGKNTGTTPETNQASQRIEVYQKDYFKGKKPMSRFGFLARVVLVLAGLFVLAVLVFLL